MKAIIKTSVSDVVFIMVSSLTVTVQGGTKSGSLRDMDEQYLQLIPRINADDWEQTPASVREVLKQLVLKVEQIDQLEQRLKELEIENQQLREKVNRNSENSHSPPASDPPNVEKTKKKKPTGKKRGGQPGHPDHSRPLYPVEECTLVSDYYPQACNCCGERLTGVDPKPYRHQVVEIPPIKLQIAEHRLHQLTCTRCGEKNRAVLPEAVEASGYGETVVAIVSVLSGMYRHSHRMVATSLRSQNRNVLAFMTEAFAPLGKVVLLLLCYPRRVLPQSQYHWPLDTPPLNGYEQSLESPAIFGTPN